jgi:hypothetical protein
MPSSAPLILTHTTINDLRQLRAQAAARPVDMRSLAKKIGTHEGKRAFRAQMLEQTVIIPGPWPFNVTYSVETGHPFGMARHLSMSVARAGRAPNPYAVWMVAEELGFRDGLEACHVWVDDRDGVAAVCVAQDVGEAQP